jgi:dolichol-phosphate mannosyltransferase
MKKIISICIPVYNEEDNINIITKEIESFFLKIDKLYHYEIIFSNNCSSDKTFEIINQCKKKNNKIRSINFDKNIGYDLSVYFNLLNSKGNAAIVIDCDLQDPIENIKFFIDKWETGYDLIYGVRLNKYENFFFYFWRKLFYIILSLFSKRKYPLYAGDFRLIDRSIINKFNIKEDIPIYTRCISYDHSIKSVGINYFRNLRTKGKSKFSFYNSIKYAFKFILLKTIFINFTILIIIFPLVLLNALNNNFTLMYFYIIMYTIFTSLAALYKIRLIKSQKKICNELTIKDEQNNII